MRTFKLFAFSLVFFLFSGASIQAAPLMDDSQVLRPSSFLYKDGGSSIYYAFTVGNAAQADTAVFFYGGSGCISLKSFMPAYVSGLTVDAHIFVLNKRFVPDAAHKAATTAEAKPEQPKTLRKWAKI